MTDRADTYKRLFERTGIDGAAVLEDLMRRFSSQPTYVRGGQEAEREGCFRAGQRSVIEYMIKQINKANGVTDETSDLDE
jgi:hypothetical protein